MVDALRRASRWVQPEGCLIDIHPTGIPTVESGGRAIGVVETANGPERHAAADAALRQGIDEGLFVEAAQEEFEFHTHGDTVEDLREYIESNWCNSRVTWHAERPAGPARAIERVRLTKLFLAQKTHEGIQSAPCDS